jgi:VWFA-related protein
LFVQQASDVTIHQNVIRARLDVRVALKHNAETLSDLTADDFTVSENGRAAVVKGADHQSVPLDLILMLDVSDSMNHVADELTQAAGDFLSTLAPDDRLAVVEFGGSIVARTEFTSDRETLIGAVEHARADVGKAPGATAIFDSVAAALEMFEGPAPANRRRAVLVVTDDIDNQSRMGTREVTAAVLEKDAVLNAVVIGSPMTTLTKSVYKAGPSRFVLPLKSLKPVANETGGEFLPGRHSVELVKTALERIRTRYLITYDPGSESAVCPRILTELTKAARTRYPDAVIYAPRHRSCRP